MFYDVLSESRKKVLPKLGYFKRDFYLAGGTGLALQFGHRKSDDFDFFTQHHFATDTLFDKIISTFDQSLKKIQEEQNTLTILISNEIKISFFHYPYPLLDPLIEEFDVKIASVSDIGCMKLSAIVSRATMKDYVDLYFILQKISLPDLLKKCQEKLANLDINLVLKSLVYYDDIIEEPIIFTPAHKVPFEQIKNFLIDEVKKYIRIS